MPYIIETSTPRYHSAFGREVPHLTHTAVATLDEARDAVTGIAKEREPFSHKVETMVGNDLSAMRESGRTVGPLPDGTVIEVQYFDWAALDNLTWGSTRRLRDPEVIGDAERATLSHFNSREAACA